MTKYETYFLKRSISYEGKTVAITGATGSLGFYIAYFLLLKGAKLILIGRNYKKLPEWFLFKCTMNQMYWKKGM